MLSCNIFEFSLSRIAENAPNLSTLINQYIDSSRLIARYGGVCTRTPDFIFGLHQ